MRVRLHPRDKYKLASSKCPSRRALARKLPRRTCLLRNAAESTFSAHKRRFGDLTPSRSELGLLCDVLLHGVFHTCALLMA
jgi:hypothetical protein